MGVATGVFLMSAKLPDGGSMKFEGTLVDTKCYSMMPMKNAGQDHVTMGMDGKMMDVKGCATACANMGIPVGLLDKKGKLHTLAAPATQLAPYMSKDAKIVGKEMNGVILIDKIEVKEGSSWKEVNLVYMMK